MFPLASAQPCFQKLVHFSVVISTAVASPNLHAPPASLGSRCSGEDSHSGAGSTPTVVSRACVRKLTSLSLLRRTAPVVSGGASGGGCARQQTSLRRLAAGTTSSLRILPPKCPRRHGGAMERLPAGERVYACRRPGSSCPRFVIRTHHQQPTWRPHHVHDDLPSISSLDMISVGAR